MGVFNLLDRVVRRGVSEVVIFEQQPEGNRRRNVSHSIPGRGVQQRKGSEEEEEAWCHPRGHEQSEEHPVTLGYEQRCSVILMPLSGFCIPYSEMCKIHVALYRPLGRAGLWF